MLASLPWITVVSPRLTHTFPLAIKVHLLSVALTPHTLTILTTIPDSPILDPLPLDRGDILLPLTSGPPVAEATITLGPPIIPLLD